MMSDLADDADEVAGLVDQRDVAVAAGLHQDDRVADRVVEVERVRLGRHQASTGCARSTLAADDPAEDVALGQDAGQAARRVADEHRIARPGPLDGADALGQRRPRQDGHGLAPAEHAQPLLGQRRDAARDSGFGDVAHAQV